MGNVIPLALHVYWKSSISYWVSLFSFRDTNKLVAICDMTVGSNRKVESLDLILYTAITLRTFHAYRHTRISLHSKLHPMKVLGYHEPSSRPVENGEPRHSRSYLHPMRQILDPVSICHRTKRGIQNEGNPGTKPRSSSYPGRRSSKASGKRRS